MIRDSERGPSGRLWSGEGKKASTPSPMLSSSPRPEAKPDRAYVAFTVRDQAERLEINRAAAPTRFPATSYLLDISYDRFHQSAFTLVYTFMVVDVQGWNLEPVVDAISLGNCGCITEFDKHQHDQPGKGQPLIESIQITTVDEARMK